MSAVWRWSVRLFAICAMLFFATLMVVFVVITVNHFGQKEYVTDNVEGLPPVYVLTAILVPFCAAFVVGFGMLFFDSFRGQPGSEQPEYVPMPAPAAAPALAPLAPAETVPRRERLANWARAHKPNKPHWPRRAD
jgi:hypothetical protein